MKALKKRPKNDQLRRKETASKRYVPKKHDKSKNPFTIEQEKRIKQHIKRMEAAKKAGLW